MRARVKIDKLVTLVVCDHHTTKNQAFVYDPGEIDILFLITVISGEVVFERTFAVDYTLPLDVPRLLEDLNTQLAQYRYKLMPRPEGRGLTFSEISAHESMASTYAAMYRNTG